MNLIMVTFAIDPNKTSQMYMLRNGQEMPLGTYKEIRKEHGNSIGDNAIWEIYQDRQKAKDNQGNSGQNAGEATGLGEKDIFGVATHTMAIELEKAKYILEHPSIFSKTDVARAKKAFKLD